MARKLLVAGNWKMNLGLDESVQLAEALAAGVQVAAGVELAVFPQMPWLLSVRRALDGTGIGVGAQNGHPNDSGAYTGEVSIRSIASRCTYILAGHSERRHIFGESDAFVGEKVTATLAHGSTPVLCVGETLEERRADQAEAVVVRQLSAGLQHVKADLVSAVVIAYEPVWAIGTGVAATPDDAQVMCAAMRRWVAGNVGAAHADAIRMLYGGSVTPENAAALFTLEDVDGGLVGGASLKAESFLAIAAAAVHVAAL